jgi:hypothetical protein
MVTKNTAETESSPSPTDQLSDRERSLLRAAEHIRSLREQYWDALTNGPAYEANRLQDELRLAQHRFRERAKYR